MRGCGHAGVWQERILQYTAQNSGRTFALDGAWGAKVGLGPAKTDAIFLPEKFIKTHGGTVPKTDAIFHLEEFLKTQGGTVSLKPGALGADFASF